MEVLGNQSPDSWMITPDNKFVEEIPDNKTELPNPDKDEVLDKNLQTDEDKIDKVDEVINDLPTSVSDVFEKLRADKALNFGFYENKKIETQEDIAEFIEINANARYENAVKNIDKQWYESKPLVFQQFAQMAELAGNDVNKLYDLIDTQKTIDDFSTFDTKDPIQAELIIENYLKLKKEPSDVIKEEVADLKERGIISDRAEKYKPLIIAHFEKEKANKIVQEQQNLTTFYKAINENEKNVVSFLSAKDIDGMKWQDEDKDLVYTNLSYDAELQGFPIFKKIEELQAQGKFDVLSKIILLAEKAERFDELYVNKTKSTVAKDLRGKIRFAADVTDTADTHTQQKVVQKDNDTFSLPAYKY